MRLRTVQLLIWLLLPVLGYAQLVVRGAQGNSRPDPLPPDATSVRIYGNRPSALGFGFVGAEPISSKIVKGAPYSAEATIETAQTLSDGNRLIHRQTVHLYRDSQGRTRREDTLAAIGPWAAAGKPATVVTIQDPTKGTSYVLDAQQQTATKVSLKAIGQSSGVNIRRGPDGSDKTVLAIGGVQVTSDSTQSGVVTTNPAIALGLRDSDSPKQIEALGREQIAGITAEGSRSSEIIPANAIGNERPMEIISETWWSPQLKVVLRSKHCDPRLGDTTYEVTKIDVGEPPASFFKVPPNYRIVQIPALPPLPHRAE